MGFFFASGLNFGGERQGRVRDAGADHEEKGRGETLTPALIDGLTDLDRRSLQTYKPHLRTILARKGQEPKQLDVS
jgi:hypothetical protein